MKRIKSIVFAGLFICFGIILGACAETTSAKQEQPIKI